MNQETARVRCTPEFPDLGDRLLILYDGHCGFCNRSIRWFLKRDRFDRFRFAPAESPAAASLLARHNFGALSPNTLIVVRHAGKSHERLLTRTTGIIAMLVELPRPWSGFAIVLSAIPRSIRDLGYGLIARLRYRIWGRYDTCPIPTPEERRHFLQ